MPLAKAREWHPGTLRLAPGIRCRTCIVHQRRDQTIWAMARPTSVSERLPVVFPVHARVLICSAWDYYPLDLGARLILTDSGLPRFPLLVDERSAGRTDSGGIRETTVLGVPCLTLRTSTERR
jgi:UDP-N-acetylglucosamine 2-epimerase